MNKNDLYPLCFNPILKKKVWGSELWLLSDRKEDNTIICSGNFSNNRLQIPIRHLNKYLLGDSFDKSTKRFPLVIKILTINDLLSVQVHPDDLFSKKKQLDDPGKNEFWYIWKNKPAASLFCGFSKKISRKTLLDALNKKTLPDILQKYKTSTGEGYFVKAGVVHAPGKGNTIIEIQQNSDITYRLFDWDRGGLNNTERSLQLDKALECILFNKNDQSVLIRPTTITTETITSHLFQLKNFYSITELVIPTQYDYSTDHNTFEILICLEGHGNICYHHDKVVNSITPGSLLLLPAYLGAISIRSESGIKFLSIKNKRN
ncbi:type I phosphomannose isomerase catalytic subunit [Chlamydiota bacterium]